ncbi:hypothetical protein [Bacillus fonticola]|uniref:hypothetical protein n=1 Tax=Bacillus fonticola TaxID=2728853 RepID=UPI001476291C|nr:hypothetical protein [Bacillus fonticola]
MMGCLWIQGVEEADFTPDSLIQAYQQITDGYLLTLHPFAKRTKRGVSFHNWTRWVEEEFHYLEDVCEKVHVAGFGTGGLLALSLAQRWEVTSCQLVNTGMYVYAPMTLREKMHRRKYERTARDFLSFLEEQQRERLLTSPMAAGMWCKQRAYEAKQCFSNFSVPTIVIDDVEQEAWGKKLFTQLGTSNKLHVPGADWTTGEESWKSILAPFYHQVPSSKEGD